MKRLFLFIFALVLLVTVQSGCRRGGEAWAAIEQGGVLRVGIDPTYPPFENTDGVTVAGIDIDLMQSIGDELGLTIQFVHYGYDGLYDALAVKQIDVLASALVVDVQKTRDFAYSIPYFNAGQILVTGAGSDVDGLAALANRQVAVELGTEGHVVAIKWQKQVPGLKIMSLNTPQEAIDAVVGGSAETAIIDSVTAQIALAQSPDLKLVEEVTIEPYALVVRQADEALLRRLDEALNTLIENGTLDTILRTHLK